MISDKLKPTAQCAKAASTAAKVLSQISRTFHYRDRHVFIRLYKQYVLPHLDFASQAWSPWLSGDKEVLENVQKRAIKQVTGLAGRSYEERLGELGMVTLEERRHQADMAQVYKILHGKDRVDPASWFEMAASRERMTRRAADPLNLAAKHCRLDMRRNFFSQRVVNRWNIIPAELKNARTVQQFKKDYKRFRRNIVLHD